MFWEWYLAKGGKISAGGFDKEFNSYIFPGSFRAPFLNQGIYTFTSYVNSGPARVYGVEAEYTQQFTFLAAPFDGFGLDTNLTYNQSSAQITRTQPNGSTGAESIQLPSTSPWNFNAAVFYERGPIQFRLAANYVSKNIFTLGGSKQTDVYTQQRFRLDVGTAVQVTKNIQVYLDGHNLTDQGLKFTETPAASRIIQREFYGIDVIGGVRVSY